jgi:N-acetylmuramoyl-L-alanine amidase
MDAIAQQLTRGLTRYFGLSFIYPMKPETGIVDLSYGTLNLRSYPSSDGTVLANLPNGAEVTVYGEWQGWYVVHYQDYVGYAAAAFIDT